MLKKFKISMSLSSIVCLTAFLFSPATMHAASLRTTKVGEAARGGGDIKACQSMAVFDAVIQGVALAAKKTPGGENLSRGDIERLMAENGVIELAEPQEYSEGGGKCSAKVRILIDPDALAVAIRKLNETHVARVSEGNQRIGVVLRFLVDGMPAETTGMNLTDAQDIMAKRLNENGFSPDIVGRAADFYHGKIVKATNAVGSEQSQSAPPPTVVNMDDEIKFMIELARGMKNHADADAILKQMASFRYVTLGEIKVSRKGIDKQSPVFIADAVANIRIVEIKSDGIIVDSGHSGGVSVTAEGKDQNVALRNALDKAVVGAASAMVAQLKKNAERNQ